MALPETLLFYLLIGLAVAVAVVVSGDKLPHGLQFYQTITATLFWPVYVPILLNRPAAAADEERDTKHLEIDDPQDEIAARIAQVEGELDAALTSLDGWAEEALAREHERIAELRTAWRLQAVRIREMDRLLAVVDRGSRQVDIERDAQSRVVASERARRQNLQRLREVRDQAYNDLAATLSGVRELVSMIHLAKFTGAPASRAEELVTQVAAAVEGLSEVAMWSTPESGTSLEMSTDKWQQEAPKGTTNSNHAAPAVKVQPSPFPVEGC